MDTCTRAEAKWILSTYAWSKKSLSDEQQMAVKLLIRNLYKEKNFIVLKLIDSVYFADPPMTLKNFGSRYDMSPRTVKRRNQEILDFIVAQVTRQQM